MCIFVLLYLSALISSESLLLALFPSYTTTSDVSGTILLALTNSVSVSIPISYQPISPLSRLRWRRPTTTAPSGLSARLQPLFSLPFEIPGNSESRVDMSSLSTITHVVLPCSFCVSFVVNLHVLHPLSLRSYYPQVDLQYLDTILEMSTHT